MSVTAAEGWLAAGVRAGTKASGDLDLALFVSEGPASVAGAFTTSRIVGAPIVVSRPRVGKGRARGCVVSAGIANVATGSAGIEDAERMVAAAAEAARIPPEEMLVSATGLIGPRIPLDAVLPAIEAAAGALSREGGEDAARAILTTDAGVKTAVRRVETGDGTVTVGGMAKGAGMVAPRMELHATMLAFLTTDAVVAPEALRAAIGASLDHTFNSITVDGCTSTSDTVLLFANGATGIDVGGSDAFVAAVGEVMKELAYAMVRDGEGAAKVVRVRVTGAATTHEARRASREVALSLLVRCAVAGGDPNWGRVAQALGQAPDLDLDLDRLRIAVAGVPLAERGVRTGREAEATAAMAGDEVEISVDLGVGTETWEFLTCDMTVDYVRFNADYRT